MSSYSYSSSSYSSSSTTSGGQTTAHSYSTESHSDASGTTVRSTSQRSGQPAVQETRYYDETGREVPADAATGGRRLEGASGDFRGTTTTASSGRQIEDVTDRDDDGNAAATATQKGESEADRLYRERMEDEYAKREGGA